MPWRHRCRRAALWSPNPSSHQFGNLFYVRGGEPHCVPIDLLRLLQVEDLWEFFSRFGALAFCDAHGARHTSGAHPRFCPPLRPAGNHLATTWQPVGTGCRRGSASLTPLRRPVLPPSATLQAPAGPAAPSSQALASPLSASALRRAPSPLRRSSPPRPTRTRRALPRAARPVRAAPAAAAARLAPACGCFRVFLLTLTAPWTSAAEPPLRLILSLAGSRDPREAVARRAQRGRRRQARRRGQRRHLRCGLPTCPTFSQHPSFSQPTAGRTNPPPIFLSLQPLARNG